MKNRNEKVLRALRPNAGLAALYRKKLLALVDEMTTSVERWITAAYRRNEPNMAQDADPPQIAATWVGGKRPWTATIDGEPLRSSKGAVIRFNSSGAAVWAARKFAGEVLPADQLQAAMTELSDYWLDRFAEHSRRLGTWFGKSVAVRTDTQLRAILRDAGVSVRFQMTPGMKDVLNATVNANVSLIKSIPEQYLKNVEGMVMRSVARGRDLSTLSREIEHQYGVSKRRAALIARDQNNKATAYMHDARRKELGIQEAIWIHSGGGKEPRPKHVAADGKRFNVGIGLPIGDKGQYVLPGEEINCFPGSTEIEFAHLVEVAYRRWFDGELTGLITATGKTLRATGNHPILTPDGWVAAGLLNEGDYVIEVGEESVERPEPKIHADHAPATLAQIFEALAKTGTTDLAAARPEHFHGDGEGGDVDVVFAARPLSIGFDPACSQSGGEFGFTSPAQARSSQGFPAEFASRCLRAAARFVGGAGESFAPRLAFAGHPNEVGLASAAYRTADAFDPRLQRFPLVPGASRHGEQALPGFMLRSKPERIIALKRRCFSGHVYNLQTRDGWYVAGGVIAHNCRCVSRSIIPGL